MEFPSQEEFLEVEEGSESGDESNEGDLEEVGFQVEASADSWSLPLLASKTEEVNKILHARERGVLYGAPSQLEFLPLLAVEVYKNEGPEFVSSRPSLDEVMLGKDLSHFWDPVVAYSRMSPEQLVLLAKTSVQIQAAWLVDPLAAIPKYKTHLSSGGLTSPFFVCTNTHAVLDRCSCSKHNKNVSVLQVARWVQGVSGTKARPEMFDSGQARRHLVPLLDIQKVDEVKYAEAFCSGQKNAEELMERSDTARAEYGTGGLDLPKTQCPVTGQFHTHMDAMDPDVTLLTHSTDETVKVPLGSTLVSVTKITPTMRNSPFMLPCLIFDPQTEAARPYSLQAKPFITMVFSGFHGRSILKDKEPADDFCPEFVKTAMDRYHKDQQEASDALGRKIKACFEHAHGVGFALATVALHKKKLVLNDTYVGHTALTNHGFSGARGVDTCAPFGTYQQIHSGPAELLGVNKSEPWADPLKGRFGLDATTGRIIPPPYNVALPTHSPRFAVVVLQNLLRHLPAPDASFWSDSKHCAAASAMPAFRRLLQYHLPLLVELGLDDRGGKWLQFVVLERNSGLPLRRLNEADPETPSKDDFHQIVRGSMSDQIARCFTMSAMDWRHSQQHNTVRVTIAGFVDFFLAKDANGKYVWGPYDLTSWSWKLPTTVELRRWEDVLWLFRRLSGGFDTITNYMPSSLLASYDEDCLAPIPVVEGEGA